MKNNITYNLNNISIVVGFFECKETSKTPKGREILKFVVTSSQKKPDGTYQTTYIHCETWNEKLFMGVKMLEKYERIKLTGTFIQSIEDGDKKRHYTFPKIIVWGMEKIAPKTTIEGF